MAKLVPDSMYLPDPAGTTSEIEEHAVSNNSIRDNVVDILIICSPLYFRKLEYCLNSLLKKIFSILTHYIIKVISGTPYLIHLNLFYCSVKKRRDQRHSLIHGIFQDIVPTIRVAVDLGLGEALPPFGQEVPVEDEIQFTPADQHRQVTELPDPVGDAADQVIDAVTGR